MPIAFGLGLVTPTGNLVAQSVLAVMLTFGAWLARRKHYRAHGVMQTSVVVLNMGLIVAVMVPAFRQALPNWHETPADRAYLVASLHGLLGTVAEVLALYVLLVAGTTFVPERLRFKDYRRWMLATLAVWWLAFLLGCGTYYLWNAQGPQGTNPAGNTRTSQNKVMIVVRNFRFEPAQITVAPGTVVEWVDENGRHTVRSDDGAFESPVMVANGKFERKFEKPSEYRYFCTFHGDAGGKDMSGTVIVNAR